MTSPRDPEDDAASPAAAFCIEPDCERPVVRTAAHCRVHLAEALRREGEMVPFPDPELSGMYAAVIQIANTAFAELAQDLLEFSAPAAGVDVFVLLDPEAEWQLAQVALDFLGTHLSDRPPFGGMALAPPMELGPKIALALQVAVPASAGDRLLPHIRFAVGAMMEEILGSDVSAMIDVEMAGEPSA